MCRVLNARIVGKTPAPGRVYLGRPSKWGSPFVIGRDGSREEVIARYRAWLASQREMLNALDELRGRDLVCWCAPHACHGDIPIELANWSRRVRPRQAGGAVSAC